MPTKYKVLKQEEAWGEATYLSPIVCPAGGRFRLRYSLGEFTDCIDGTKGICCCKNYGKALLIKNGLSAINPSVVYVIAIVEPDGDEIINTISKCKSERQLNLFYEGIADERTKIPISNNEVWYPRIKVKKIL